MKEVLRSLLFAFGVIAIVVVWYSFSNNFTGVITRRDELNPSAEMVLQQSQMGVATPEIDKDQIVRPPAAPGTSGSLVIPKAVSEKDVFLRSAVCRAQQDDFLKRKTHSEIIASRKNNPDLYDIKCFMVNESVDLNTLVTCLSGKKSAAISGAIESVMCQAFLKVYQTYVVDFLYPDDVDVKSLSQSVLQKKIQAQLLRQNKNPQLMLAMTQTLLESYPNDFEALKIYIKALGFGQKPEVYAEGGPLFNHLVKAYSLNPRDLEIREMYMYALIYSPDGEAKLLKTFPNVKEDGKLQALRYYYLAWAGWNKGDRTQALNNLEFAKSLSNNDPRFVEAYDKVKDQLNVAKAEGLFYLSFSLI